MNVRQQQQFLKYSILRFLFILTIALFSYTDNSVWAQKIIYEDLDILTKMELYNIIEGELPFDWSLYSRGENFYIVKNNVAVILDSGSKVTRSLEI